MTLIAYDRVSPYLARRFSVRRFHAPSVLWLNHRWFAEQGVDLTNEGAHGAICDDLIERFGVSAPSYFEPSAGYGEQAPPLACDSYGAPQGTVHGGSGRVGGRNGWQAKGIGRTPLAVASADATDPFHSDGCLWLEEALRETVFSEVAATEFPFGAVPVLALIDTGARFYLPDGRKTPFRAILVRPESLRLAHLQRSIFFGTAGFAGSDQELDALRTRDVWRWFQREHGEGLDVVGSLAEVFRRVGVQYGFAHVSRLWPGPFYSSNVALDGRLLDFGLMRWLPEMRRQSGTPRERRFGGEKEFVVGTARSLASLLRKYAGRWINPDVLGSAYDLGVAAGRTFGLARFGNSAVGELRLDADSSGRDPWRKFFSGACSLPADLSPARPTLMFANIQSKAIALAETLEPGDPSNVDKVSAFIKWHLVAQC